jgi:molybdopterin-guanine dinucleotide biosynthesis protein A
MTRGMQQLIFREQKEAGMQRKISAGILAGGKSSRMGENKAFLEFGEEPFLYRISRICSRHEDILISVDDLKKYPDLPYPAVADEKQGFGPLEGIYQLLSHVKHPYCLIVATDMPLLTEEFLSAFEDRLTGTEDCMILRAGGRIHPLCGVYKKTVIPVLEQMRRQELHKIRLLYERVNTTYMDLEELGFSADIVENINTPREYETLTEHRGCADEKAE